LSVSFLSHTPHAYLLFSANMMPVRNAAASQVFRLAARPGRRTIGPHAEAQAGLNR